ncbi:hypothetical protein B5807_04003 [Epicoccum nigrum]|uniref:Uncharacterized protein n=1 Tax=Epicoccum nigrum TaxID=105696 RepID=A0A1Y2M5Y8_EPING|nr:hypothetical protein B5807_04003 [Epicoccum nigrum]
MLECPLSRQQPNHPTTLSSSRLEHEPETNMEIKPALPRPRRRAVHRRPRPTWQPTPQQQQQHQEPSHANLPTNITAAYLIQRIASRAVDAGPPVDRRLILHPSSMIQQDYSYAPRGMGLTNGTDLPTYLPIRHTAHGTWHVA